MTHIRKHSDCDTPSAPPVKKGSPRKESEKKSDDQECSLSSAPPNQTMLCGSSNRNYHTLRVKTIPFAVPEGYDQSPENVSYLGGGAYGNVIKTSAICRDGIRRWVAIKKLKDPFLDPFQARRIYREIKLLQLMRHDNIICALDLYTPDTKDKFRDVYVVTQFAGRSIYTILKHQRENGMTILSPEHVKFIIYQILRALKYIHSANIIHRDLKPGNLAITNDSDLTVLDFGLARSLERKDPSLTQYVQTRWYRSPEVIYWKIDSYTNEADMWSVGCIAAELLTGNPLFPGDDVNMQYQRIIQLCGSPDIELLDKIERDNSTAMRKVIQSFKFFERRDFHEYFAEHAPTNEFIDFIERLLVLDPEKRITVEEAIAHPYLSEFSLPEDEPRSETIFDLGDDCSRTSKEWRDKIWSEIENFNRLPSSPLIPRETTA